MENVRIRIFVGQGFQNIADSLREILEKSLSNNNVIDVYFIPNEKFDFLLKVKKTNKRLKTIHEIVKVLLLDPHCLHGINIFCLQVAFKMQRIFAIGDFVNSHTRCTQSTIALRLYGLNMITSGLFYDLRIMRGRCQLIDVQNSPFCKDMADMVNIKKFSGNIQALLGFDKDWIIKETIAFL